MFFYIDPDIKKLEIKLLELKIKNQELMHEALIKGTETG